MTLAPARPLSTPSQPDGVDPSVTAVVITRRDPRGLAALLDAVFAQTLIPDAVLVLDRTAGAALPADHDRNRDLDVDPAAVAAPADGSAELRTDSADAGTALPEAAGAGPAGRETSGAGPAGYEADADPTVSEPAGTGHGPTGG